MFQYEQEYENEIKPKLNLGTTANRKKLYALHKRMEERKQAKIQAKLKADKANSPQEKEADTIAKELVSGKGDVKEKVDQLQIQAKSKEEGVEVSPEISNAIQAELGNGQALSQQEKDFFELKFGNDFSDVKIHNDSKAHDLADSIHAKAFTVGNDIFMGKNEHQPNTQEGKELMAHELTHTIQQNSREVSIQKAEVDESAVTRPLKYSSKKLNEYINTIIREAYKNAKDQRKVNSDAYYFILINYIYNKLGKNESIGRTAIEIWAEENLDVDIPKKENTKYKNVTGFDAFLWSANLLDFKILNPVVNVNGLYIGTDKLGHFFQQGSEYFRKYLYSLNKLKKSDKESEEDAKSYGISTETGKFGLDRTGVFSNADLAANYAGFQFYKKLFFSSEEVKNFQIEKLIKPSWNEIYNPNEYSTDLAKKIWSHLLLDYEWSGFLEGSSGKKQIRLLVQNFGKYDFYGNLFNIANGKIIGEIKCDIEYVNVNNEVNYKSNGKIEKKNIVSVSGIKLKNKNIKIFSKNEIILTGQWNNYDIELRRGRKIN